jgi:hypothetical protein
MGKSSIVYSLVFIHSLFSATSSKEVTLLKQSNHIHATQDRQLHAITPVTLLLPTDLPPTNTSLNSLKVTYTLNIHTRITESCHIGTAAVTLCTPITLGTANSKSSADINGDWWQGTENEFNTDVDDLPPPYVASNLNSVC